jgi:hypothetical protein
VNSSVGAPLRVCCDQTLTPFTQVTTEVIAMSDEELQNIGVTHLGDRMILRNIRKNIIVKYAMWDVIFAFYV